MWISNGDTYFGPKLVQNVGRGPTVADIDIGDRWRLADDHITLAPKRKSTKSGAGVIAAKLHSGLRTKDSSICHLSGWGERLTRKLSVNLVCALTGSSIEPRAKAWVSLGLTMLLDCVCRWTLLLFFSYFSHERWLVIRGSKRKKSSLCGLRLWDSTITQLPHFFMTEASRARL